MQWFELAPHGKWFEFFAYQKKNTRCTHGIYYYYYYYDYYYYYYSNQKRLGIRCSASSEGQFSAVVTVTNFAFNNISFIYHSNISQNVLIKLLNPTGHVTHQQLNIQQLHVLPTLYLCVLYLSENKERLVPLTA
jgi:hypothetical protein